MRPAITQDLGCTCSPRETMSSPSPAIYSTLRDLRASSVCALCVKSFPAMFCALFVLSSSQCTKDDSLTPVFSVRDPHFFALFFTLAQISPVLATLTKKTRGYPLCSPPIRNYSSYRPIQIRCGARSCRFNELWFDVKVELDSRQAVAWEPASNAKPEETERCDS